MKTLQKILFLTIILYSWSLISLQPWTSNAHAIAKPLKTDSTDSAEVKGTFTVILFGGAHADDLETVAFLDYEDDQYTLEPFAPDFDYKMKKGLSAEEALRVADKSVRFHPSFWKTQLSKIVGLEGNIVGFELKPLYIPFIYGTSELWISITGPKKAERLR